jgi:hypothetical protein
MGYDLPTSALIYFLNDFTFAVLERHVFIISRQVRTGLLTMIYAAKVTGGKGRKPVM